MKTRNLLRQEWRLLLFGFALMFFSSPGQTFFISLFGEQIRIDLDLSHGEFGLLYSAATLISAFCLLKTAPLLDRYSMSRVALSITLGLAVACLAMALSRSVAVLFIAFVLLRHFGQGLFSTASTTAMMRYLPDVKGRANAFSKLGFSAAEVVTPTAIVMMLIFVDWRFSWAVIALVVALIMPLVITLAAPMMMADRSTSKTTVTSGEPTVVDPQWTRQQVLRDPTFYLLMPALLAQPMLHTGFMFHQIPLVVEKGWPLTTWGALYSIYAVSTSLVLFVGGQLVDRIGSMRLIPIILLPAIGAFMVLWKLNEVWAAALFFVLMGTTSGIQAAVFAPFLAERYGVQHYAAIRSLAYFVLVLMTAVSPVLMGALIDQGWALAQLAGLAVIYCGAAICLALLGTLRLAREKM